MLVEASPVFVYNFMVWNLKEHRRSLPTTENRTKVIAEDDFLVRVSGWL